MANLSRKDLEVRYEMFDKFSLVDQRAYYLRTIERHDEASGQVNRIRAMISLFTGISAAIAGLVVAVYFTSTGTCSQTITTGLPENCIYLGLVVDIAILLSVALPALGGFYGTLADLYQWDRQISIYKSAAESIEVADAHSPYNEMDDETYRASMIAYAQGTLQVMSDETAQWGQSIRTPKGLEAYVEKAREKSEAVGGNANAGRTAEVEEPIRKTNLPDRPVSVTKTSPEAPIIPDAPAPEAPITPEAPAPENPETPSDTGGENSAG